MSENMLCLILCSCVSLLRMMVSRFIHVPTKERNSSIFMAAYYFSMLYMCQIFFMKSITDRNVGWFQDFATVNSVALNIYVHVSVLESFIILWVYTESNSVPGSRSLKNLHTVFLSD